ncbi:nitrate/nitrite transporter [Pseudalkalibacillus sp. R45]|uniref:nitrate/nitrite transporter n=1 Tax=Pseudalkalibacillus sp. R45 TaxID=3457433 RepID=UPI003FCCED33
MISRIQLPLQTTNLIVGFMTWVLISSLMPFIKEDIQMNAGQLALVTAIPVILGSLLRIPLGYMANRIGARIVFATSFFVLLIPVYLISEANTFTMLAIGGLMLGVSGAVFSVGVTSLPKYYPKSRHGFVNGIYGAGNIGTAITAFSAPVVANYLGWTVTVKLFLILLGVFGVLNLLVGDRHEKKVKTSLIEQLKGVYKNEKLWLLSLFYFITFGSFVAFTIYLPNFLVTHFGLDKVDAGMRTAGFIVLCTLLRPVGGWLADRYDALKALMVVFTGFTIAAVALSFAPSIEIYTIGCLTIAMSAGIGNGVIFKLVPLYFHREAGIVNGIVSCMGGLGGFFPPLILMFVFNITGHYAIGFMALSQVALASLILVIWMYYQGRLHLSNDILRNTVEGIMITDTDGKIKSVNPAFTKLTGYESKDVVGKRANLLKSGIQDAAFYKKMWKQINETGFWQGEIWNKKKNGDVYLEWLTISAIKNDAGDVEHYAGMFSDVTDHKAKITEVEG